MRTLNSVPSTGVHEGCDLGAVDSEPVWIGRVEVCANSIRVVLNVVVEDGHVGLEEEDA